MSKIKGPALFLAQFLGNKPPFDTLENITSWAKSFGYSGVQIPTWDSRVIDLDKASESVDYCDELKGRCNGLEITELAAHFQGQLIAVNTAYDAQFDLLAPPSLRGNHQARTEWAEDQMKMAIKASQNLGLSVVPTLSGALLWHYIYPFPERPKGLVNLAFKELAKRWQPILNTAQECGIDLAYEVHAGTDIHDGVTFELFLEETGNHERVNILYDPSHLLLQCLDYIGYITCYKDRIRAFHVKDAEFSPSARSGVYGGYQEWKERPGRFRNLGDGQIDFKRVFTKMTEIGYRSWAVLEWECCVKGAAQGAREGAEFIRSMLIEAFDDFDGGEVDMEFNRKILGLN